MTAYYNEFDPFAAQWLRNLIAAGHIAPGDVDERSIWDVTPDDLKSYTQCHFFAGIGVWSHALRSAGWDDDRRIWTGSCPCQPFSEAGAKLGFDDERHLWPFLRRLIATCNPDIFLGEQVASKDGLGWLDGVSWDLENMRIWGWFHENLHCLLYCETREQFSEILWALAGWPPTSMQRMPARLRGALAVQQQGIPGRSETEANRREQTLSSKIRPNEPRNVIGERGWTTCAQEVAALRSGSAYTGDRGAGSTRGMRNDGSYTGPNSRPQARLELPLVGPNRTGEGLHLFEHSHCLFCNKCLPRGLGGRDFAKCDECLAPKDLIHDFRPITKAFERFLGSEQGCLWLDLVSSDLENANYAFGATDLCAAGFGVAWNESQEGEWLRGALYDCPDPLAAAQLLDFAGWASNGLVGAGGRHIRQRLYFVGMDNTASARHFGEVREPEGQARDETRVRVSGAGREVERVDDSDRARPQGHAGNGGGTSERQEPGRSVAEAGLPSGVVDGEGERRDGRSDNGNERRGQRTSGQTSAFGGADAPNRGKRSVDWLYCRDGKWRPVEPGTFPLAHDVAARVGQLRAYGNALDAKTATGFIEAVMECAP